MKALLLALLPILALAARAAAVCDASVGCLDLSLIQDGISALSVGKARSAAILPISVIVVSDAPKNLVVEAYSADGTHRLGRSHVHGVQTSDHPVAVAVDFRPVYEEVKQFLAGTASDVTVTVRAWLTSDDPNDFATKLTEESKTITVTRQAPKAAPQTPVATDRAFKRSFALRKRQRSCDTIHQAYLAGTTMTSQDFADWSAWKCSTWFPGGIGSTSTRTCDSIYRAYTSGTAMTSQDYADWASWKCSTWYPSGIGSGSGGTTPPPPPPPPSGGSPCTNPSGGCIDTASLPTSVTATAGQGSGLRITVRAWANTPKDLFVEFRKNGAIVSNYAFASLPAATSSSWSSVSVTLTFPAQTSGTFQFFVWLTAPGASWGGQTFNTLVSTTLSGGSTPPPPPPPPPSGGGRGGSPAGAVISTCKAPGTYALTFDDGPHIYTAGLKSILASYGIKATFFLNGNNWGSIYNYGDLIRDSVAQGHQIAMHGWSHCDFTQASCVYGTEVDQLMGAIQGIIGRTPSYFRFPYGSYNSAAQNYVAGKGLRIVQWNLDTGDWQEANKANPQITLNTIQGALNAVSSSYSSFIALEHDVWPTTAGATSNSWIWAGISFIQSKGYRFVTVAECDGDPSGGYF